MVAGPLGNDQPGRAARVKARGACVVVPRRQLSAGRLHRAVMLVLEDPTYREAAQALQRTIQKIDGPGSAAEIVEQVLNLRSDRSGFQNARKDAVAGLTSKCGA